MTSLRYALLAGLLVIFGAACEPPDYPGESLGSFRIEGTLEANTCGVDAVPAFANLVFESELRMDGSTPYWRRDGLLPVGGVVRSDGRLEFEFRQTFPLGPNPDGTGERCYLTQTEHVLVVLLGDEDGVSDAGVPPGLEGTNGIHWAPASDTECAYVTVASGGPFEALPCDVDYALVGQRMEDVGGEE